MVRYTLPNARNAVWNRDARQTCAVLESSASDDGYAVRDCNVCQTRTATENSILDTCHAAWNRDICQARTGLESPVANACYAVGDCNGC